MLAVILGTRPEIIKMSPILRECEKQGLKYFILHTGQHYSYNLDKIFFDALDLPEADYNLEVGSGTHAEETGKMLVGIEKILLQERPDVVLVEGDTNTVLAGALAASKLHIKIAHIEAGLRSYDKRMPEEINRILTDHISDYLFAPTEKAKRNLLKEGLNENNIFVTGNTIVDAVYQNLKIAERKGDMLNKLNLTPKGYFLVTVHRQENVDVKERFKGILEGLEFVYREFSRPIIYAVHPRARRRIDEFGLKVPNGVELIEPVGFLEFLQLEANAKLIFTDSGGVQEESCILNVPAVTLRDNTERPETLEVGSNMLAGVDRTKILECAKVMLSKQTLGKFDQNASQQTFKRSVTKNAAPTSQNWANPFGEGIAGENVLRILTEG
jgi:UDP-N-acetylglucosamine 2-epimerase (non-hydrolysing)